MIPNKQSEPPIPDVKPAVKKVKVTNQGSEIKQMRTRAEAARKLTVPPLPPAQSSASSSKPQRTLGSALEESKASQATTINNVEKFFDQKSPKPNNVTITEGSDSKIKTLTFEKQDEVNVLSREGSIAGSKKTQLTEQDRQRNAVLSGKTDINNPPSTGKPVLPGPKVKTPKAVKTKQPVEPRIPNLQRIGKNARNMLRDRAHVSQLALDGIIPLMKNHRAIKVAVAALKRHVDDCRSDLEQVKRFVLAAQPGDIAYRDWKALFTLAALDPNLQKSLESDAPKPTRREAVKNGKGKSQSEEDVRNAPMSKMNPATNLGNSLKTKKDSLPAKKQETKTLKTNSNSATPRASMPKTHTPSNAPVVRSPRASIPSDPIEKLKSAHPRLPMAGDFKSWLKKSRAAATQSKKRKRQDVEDAPVKRIMPKTT